MFATSSISRPASLRYFRKQLLAWYQTNRRSLPWRSTSDPYRIWISEIMLQQTRVAAVLDHYKRFLKRFPSVRHLAAATEAHVLTEWSGLGYYRRARMLHRAAQVVVSDRGAVLPHSSQGLRELPGIGRYTAHAIASIAFGEPVAVVDGNVERVLGRIFGRQMAGESLWDTAQQLLDSARPGEFNQAMMELGATVCLPNVPHCGECPVKRFCASREMRSDRTSNRPSRGKPRLRSSASLLLIRRGTSFLLRQRSPSDRLMAGMWELPQSKHEPHSDPLLEVKHSITTTDWTIKVFSSSRLRKHANLRWVSISETSRLPLTGLTRKILRKLQLLA